MEPDNPFASLTLIVAPAILTNASTLLILSTSNRLARTIDRARVLADRLDKMEAGEEEEERMRMRELRSAEDRTLILVRALRSIYFTIGAFAGATLLSLMGAVGTGLTNLAIKTIEIVAVVSGSLAVAGLVYAAALLVRETHLTVSVLHEEAVFIKDRVRRKFGDSDG